MHTLCTAYLRNEEDAVEVLQDGFLKIFQQIQKFDAARSTLYTWMRTVMIRTAIDFLRKDKNAPTSIEWTEDHDPSIDAEALQRMTAEEILQLLQQLPETARTVFNLYVTEGFSHREIGEMLQISEGTSKWYLSEARKHLIGTLNKKKTA